MIRITALGLLLILLASPLNITATHDARVEERDYVNPKTNNDVLQPSMAVGPCQLNETVSTSPAVGAVCFPVRSDETRVSLMIKDDIQPDLHLAGLFAGIAVFRASDHQILQTDSFCGGQFWSSIPEDTAFVEVFFPETGKFASSTSCNTAITGTVNAAFWQ